MQVSSGMLALGAAVFLIAALVALYIWRRRPWSRLFALAVTILCIQVTLMVFPPASPPPGEQHHPKWDAIIADVMGRVIFSGLLVSGILGRWIWKSPSRVVSGPWDGNEDSRPE